LDNSKPLISIVCVTYNHVDYIEKAIIGFISQKTSFAFEVIIGDDCSSDGTSQIIYNYYIENKGIIKPILREKNIGGRENLINCLELASGKYIALCEGDDYWIDDQKLQKQLDIIESDSQIGLIWTDIDFNDQQKGKYINSAFKNKFLPVFETFEETLINKPFFAPSTWLFRKQYCFLFYKYATRGYIDGTFPFILDVLKTSKIFYINEVTGVYNKRITSVSNDLSLIKRFQFAKSIYRIQIDYVNDYNVSLEILNQINADYFKSLLPYAIIAEDNDFIIDAIKNLVNIKDFKISLLLFVSNNKILRIIFRFIFKNDNIFNYVKSIFHNSK